MGITAPGKSAASTSVNYKAPKASGPTESPKPLSEFTSALWLQASSGICLHMKVSRPKTLSEFTRKSPAAVPQRKGEEAHSTPGVPVLPFGKIKTCNCVAHLQGNSKGKASSQFYVLTRTISSTALGCPTPKDTHHLCLWIWAINETSITGDKIKEQKKKKTWSETTHILSAQLKRDIKTQQR